MAAGFPPNTDVHPQQLPDHLVSELSNEPVSTVIDATEWTHYSKSVCVWVILDIPRQVSRHQSRNELGRRDGGTQER